MDFDKLSPGEKLYYELSNIVEDDIPQMSKKKQREHALQHLLEKMIDAARTGQFPAELQLRLLDDIDANLQEFRGYTEPMRNAINAGLAGQPFPGEPSGDETK